jgi:hypothetical protein
MLKLNDLFDDKFEKTILKFEKRNKKRKEVELKKKEIEVKKELLKKEKDKNNYIYNFIRKNYGKLMKNYKDKKVVRDKITKDIVDNPNSNPLFDNLTDKNIEVMNNQIIWWDENYIDNYNEKINEYINETEKLKESNNNNDNMNFSDDLF